MRIEKCKREEKILEMSAFPGALSIREKLGLKFHLKKCEPCFSRIQQFQDHWNAVFQPKEQKIADSLLKVYSRLQKDETLILKGWKLSTPRMANSRSVLSPLLKSRFVMGFSVAALAIVGSVGVVQTVFKKEAPKIYSLQNPPSRQGIQAKIKITDKNKIQTHYLEPQLVRMVDFETADGR